MAQKGEDGFSPASPQPTPELLGIPMKWISLTSLTLQTSLQVFVIKWTKAASSNVNDVAPVYLASTVVLFTEVLKVFVSFGLVVREAESFSCAVKNVYWHFTKSYAETLKICVPALLYTVQNNLMFYSLDKLSAAVQQVTYQLKIITTAVLSVLLLGKVLGPTKWIAVLMLIIGISMVQWPRDAALLSGSEPLQGEVGVDWIVENMDAFLGLGAVLAACFTSGLASVCLEKILKQTDASIWMRNVQLGLFGTLMSFLTAFSSDGERIQQHGLTQGYNVRVLCSIFTNALGGLLCAAVLKYADNILRCFSTALSISLTCLLSWLVLQDFTPDAQFVLGTTLALAATFLYSLGLPGYVSALWTVGSRKIQLQQQLS